MSSVNSSVDTVNAAASAIVTAESRLPPTSVQKRRWGSCWSLYWCFGSQKQSKRISHALFAPESTSLRSTAPVTENLNQPTTIVFPFIAPPSSPASFLHSEPPSGTHSPAGLISLKALSVNPLSQSVTDSAFTVGPYAYETQLVTPPVFSAYTTEPSTAPFTPPPEPVQLTTPSSPEVPFAQLLSSSLARARSSGAGNQKLLLSQYEFQPYQAYAGSPGGNLRSPGSTIPNSGISTPLADKHPGIEFPVEEASKFLGYEDFPTRNWGSRLGSGTLTPSAWGSRLGSGCLTPNGGELASQDNHVAESQISEVASLANSDNGSQNDEIVVDHRVSFELASEYFTTCLEKNLESTSGAMSGSLRDLAAEGSTENNSITKKAENRCEYCLEKKREEISGEASGDYDGKLCHCRRRSCTLGSSKEFNFDNTNGEVVEDSDSGCEWWSSEKVGKELGTRNTWTFFPLLQPEVS